MLHIKLKSTQLKSKYQTKKIQEKVGAMVTKEKLSLTISKTMVKMAILIFVGGIVLFPFVYMFLLALRPFFVRGDAISFLPPSVHWDNFKQAFAEGYWVALLNTIIVVTLSIVLQIIVSMLMGYGLAYKSFFGKNALWYFLLSLMMLPQIALLIGQYILVVNLNLKSGWGAIISMVLPHVASVFSAFMFRNAFMAIPQRTKEAAYIDGVGEFGYLIKIALPVVKPTMWTVGILCAFASWNAYMWPSILTFGDPNARKILGIWLFNTGKIPDPGDGIERVAMNLRMAASILAMLPMMTVYFVFRKKIMDAVARRGSAIKG